MVEETKAFLGIMPLFLCICIYQMTYDPILYVQHGYNTTCL